MKLHFNTLYLCMRKKYFSNIIKKNDFNVNSFLINKLNREIYENKKSNKVGRYGFLLCEK